MRAFDLGCRFDVVTCLFASIAYCRSTPALAHAIGCMTRHTNPGGLVIVEPFIAPEHFKVGHVSAIFVDRPELKIARIHTGAIADGTAVLAFHYLVGTPPGLTRCTIRKDSWAAVSTSACGRHRLAPETTRTPVRRTLHRFPQHELCQRDGITPRTTC